MWQKIKDKNGFETFYLFRSLNVRFGIMSGVFFLTFLVSKPCFSHGRVCQYHKNKFI